MSAAAYYRDNRAGIIEYVITRERAAQIFREHARDEFVTGDLEEGFAYWVGCPGVSKLVYIAVTPLPHDQVPPAIKEELAAGAVQACAPHLPAVAPGSPFLGNARQATPRCAPAG